MIRSSVEKARTGRLVTSSGWPLVRNSRNRNGNFSVNPGFTRLENVAPGAYTLQIIGPDGDVDGTVTVMVQEGQQVEVEL